MEAGNDFVFLENRIENVTALVHQWQGRRPCREKRIGASINLDEVDEALSKTCNWLFRQVERSD